MILTWGEASPFPPSGGATGIDNIRNEMSALGPYIWYKRTAFLLCCIAVKLGIWVRVMRNVLKLRGRMLFGKSSMRIGMKVSNRCSIIALVSLYPSCYPWRICYLSPRDRAMRLVSWNLANCQATVQYDKSWTNRSYEVGGLRWADV